MNLWFWDAFWELGSERPAGVAAAEIPFTAIQRFAERYQIDEVDEFDRLLLIIRKLDAVYRGERAPVPPDQENAVRFDDVDGMKTMLRRMGRQPGEAAPDFVAIKKAMLASGEAGADEG